MNARSHVIALISLISLHGAQAFSTTVYDSQGFETLSFVVDTPLSGQDAGSGPWHGLGSGGTATVVAGAPNNPSQVVKFDRQGGDFRVGIVKPMPNLNTPGSPRINVEWSMSYSSSDASLYGPYFAVEVWDEDIHGNPLLAASAGLDAKTGDVLYQVPTSGYLDITGVVVDPDTWVHLLLSLDYTTQTYDLYLDGSLLLSAFPFVDGGITGFHDATIAGLPGGFEDLEANGTAYFDNFRISAVPDAGSTGALIGVGFAALVFARRKIALGAGPALSGLMHSDTK